MVFDPNTLENVLLILRDADIKVHLVPHFDGIEEAEWHYVIFDSPSRYINRFDAICQAASAVPGAVTSIELWNEAIDTRSTWAAYTPLYRSTAPKLVAIARKRLHGVKVVMPLPIDQSPQQAQFVVTGKVVPFDLFSVADEVSGHVYPIDKNAYPYPGGAAEIQRRRDVLIATAKAIGKPLIVTELGVEASLAGANTRMKDTAKAYDDSGIPFYLWTLHGNAGSYDLFRDPGLFLAAEGK